jgi:hypothetical protein
MSWMREHEADSFDDFGNIIDPSAMDEARREAQKANLKRRRTPKKPNK